MRCWRTCSVDRRGVRRPSVRLPAAMRWAASASSSSCTHIGPTAPAMPAKTIAAWISPAGPGSMSARRPKLTSDQLAPVLVLLERGGHARVCGQDSGQPTVAHCEVGVAAERAFRSGTSGPLRLGGFDDPAQLREHRFEHGGQQLFAGPEVVIDRGLRFLAHKLTFGQGRTACTDQTSRRPAVCWPTATSQKPAERHNAANASAC